MAKVWHAKKPDFMGTAQNFPNDYELVAEVDSDNLEYVFQLTNTIDRPWWENDGVTAIKQTRSTSVGDIVEINGVLNLCAMLGWQEIKG